jgi:RNA polymerase sigma-B factor
MRVPRRLQELRRSIINATEQLTHELGREPTVDELALHLRVGAEDVLEGLEAGAAYSTVPLDPLVQGDADAQGLAARLGEIDLGLVRVEHRVDLAPLIAGLPKRERSILRYRFVEGLTQTEIAERVGISQMHVSRLLTRTLHDLRRQLA